MSEDGGRPPATKGSKMHGGLIRRDKRVEKDRNGNTTTQHWDGRKDVHIKANPANVKLAVQNPGE